MCTKCPKQKRIVLFFAVIIAFFSILTIILSKTGETPAGNNARPIVSVSTYTLYEVAHAVAGESLEIHPIIPPGSDAHMFAPTPKQVADIGESALFIYNGAGFETWAESLKNTLPDTTKVLDMSQHVHLMTPEHHDDEEESDGHDHGGVDPHYWLDIENMIRMTKAVEGEFSRLFPENRAAYKTASADYIGRLQKLKEDYAAGLKECKNRTLVSNHSAFGYLAHSNNFESVAVIGLSSDEQPSAKVIAQVIALVKKHHIKTIFFEEFINDNIAQTIARESGARAESLQPLENISEYELKSHQTYESIMRGNLAKLTQAMECR